MKEKIIVSVVGTLIACVACDIYANSTIRVKWMARRFVKNSSKA